MSKAFSPERDALESAVSRLPYPVFVLEGEDRVRPMNEHAERLQEEEKLEGFNLRNGTLHPLAVALAQIRNEVADDETPLVQIRGRRFELIHSARSPKGESRWLMVMLRPFPDAISIDIEGLRRRWSLTRREAEVAAACVAGRSNAEICEALTISRETVKTHVARLLHKAGCQNRSQLIAKYLFGN